MEIKLTDDIGLGQISKYSFYNIFLKYNIKTVSDLLNEEKINEILAKCRHTVTRNQIQGYIDLVKHQLFHEPLVADVYLEQPFVPLTHDKEGNLLHNKNNQSYLNLARMGFTEQQAYLICCDATRNQGNDKTLLDIFQSRYERYVKMYGPAMKKKIDIYLDAYKNKENDTSLDNLNRELEKLKAQREKLDIKIARIEEAIKAVQEAKGSIKK